MTTQKTACKTEGRYKAKKYGEIRLTRRGGLYQGHTPDGHVIGFCDKTFRRNFGVHDEQVIVKIYHEKHNRGQLISLKRGSTGHVSRYSATGHNTPRGYLLFTAKTGLTRFLPDWEWGKTKKFRVVILPC